MKQMSLTERRKIIAESFGIIHDKYYTATEKMDQINLICSIRRI